MPSLDIHPGGSECLNSDKSFKLRRDSVSVLLTERSNAPVANPLSEGGTAPETNKCSSETLDDVDISVECRSPTNTVMHTPWNTVENITTIGLSFEVDNSPRKYPSTARRFSLDNYELKTLNTSPQIPHLRFHRWITNLQKRAVQRRKLVTDDNDRMFPVSDPLSSGLEHGASRHKKSLSGSSAGFVTAVKSASISLASFGVPQQSRRTGRSSRYQRTDNGSRASNIGIRLSEDNSFQVRGAIIDVAVNARSVQRRQVLEEIIRTEEGYVADVRFLMSVYGTLLASIPTISSNMRLSINQNLNEIVELHEQILGELHRVVPHSEYSQVDYSQNSAPKNDRKQRPLTNGTDTLTWKQATTGMTAEACIAAEVAKIFGQKMHRFFVYEEYGAKYEMMVKDVASTHRTIPQWETYQKGLEALASSIASINSQEEYSKKSLTVGDLLVKPIQRVCRYPLMFAELLKQTPVCDCPDSHIEIEKVLARLRETTAEINKATDNPRMKVTMERTWALQDRLLLNDQIGIRSKNTLRSLGRVHLCGVLHIAWQTREGVDGQHMISLLYRDYLVLASAGKPAQLYIVQAIISLSEVRVEEVDNGRGLQCQTAPFSWKLVFECDHQLYEIILSACSAKEELEWMSRLNERLDKDNDDLSEQTLFTTLSFDIKSLGTVFGKPGTIARRISIHRATTVGPKSALCQVLIKNTTSAREISQSTSSMSINRSQSLLTTNRIPVLAPARVERVRLENLLSDVWSREILPFPGMTGRVRSEHIVRASASSMMRKLSVASIANNFTKRSASYTSLASTHNPADEKHDFNDSKITHAEGWESICPGKSSLEASDDTMMSRLSIIQDENVPYEEKKMPLASSPSGSPAGTVKRLATLRAKKSWQPNRSRIITPPLRTASANSLGQNRVAPISDLPYNGNENKHQQKHSLWVKAAGMNKGMYVDGIRSFFR